MSHVWNKADTALLGAFFLFLVSLYLYLHFQGSWAKGLLMTSEAALVGGVADWFAVTALFRKPLGFPYHTAILPRRRNQLIQAIVVMVQKEFFSRRKIFRHIEKIHLIPMMLAYLHKKNTEEGLTRTVIHFIRASFLRGRNREVISRLSSRFKNMLLSEDPSVFFDRLDVLSRRNGWDRRILSSIASLLAREISTEQIRFSIRDTLAQLEHEKLGDSFLSRFLEVTNTLNLDEGAELIQRHSCRVLDDLGREGTPLHERAIALLHDYLSDLRQDDEILALANELRHRLVDELPIEETMARFICSMRTHFQMEGRHNTNLFEENLPAFYAHLQNILRIEYQHMIFLIEERQELQKIIAKVLYDLLARSALHAQTMVGVIVGNVLSRLTDEELNYLIYDKVEQDLLWIRVNGALVGGCIGFFLFLCSNFFTGVR